MYFTNKVRTFRFGVIAVSVNQSPCKHRSTNVCFWGVGVRKQKDPEGPAHEMLPPSSQSVGVRGREEWGGWRGWSHLGDRRHHLSQQTNNVSRCRNRLAAAASSNCPAVHIWWRRRNKLQQLGIALINQLLTLLIGKRLKPNF